MKNAILLFLVFWVLVLSMPLTAKERKGADLHIQKTDGEQIRGELIAVKQSSLLLMERDSGADVTVDIDNVREIIIVKKSKLLRGAGLGILVFGGSGALVGAVMRDTLHGDRGTTIVVVSGIFAGFGLVIGAIAGGLSGIDKTIQLEGKSDTEIREILKKLRKKARVKNVR